MPKMKTNKGAAKRLHVTGSGRILYRKVGKIHNMGKKTRSRQVRLKGNDEVSKGDLGRARRMLVL